MSRSYLPQSQLFRLRQGFDDNEGLSERKIIGNCQMYGGARSSGQEFLQLFRRTAGQMHRGLSGRSVDNAHVAPEHALGYAGSQRLGAGFLRRETLRIRCGALLASIRFLLLDLCKDPVAETVTMPFKRTFDTANIDEVAANPDNHTFWGSCARCRRC